MNTASRAGVRHAPKPSRRDAMRSRLTCAVAFPLLGASLLVVLLLGYLVIARISRPRHTFGN